MNDQLPNMNRRLRGLIFGSILGGFLFGLAGYTHASTEVIGAFSGVLIGGSIGYLKVTRGGFGPMFLSTLGFALFGFNLGPGVDDYGGNSVPGFATFGAIVGYIWKRRRVHHNSEPAHVETTDADPLR